MRSYHAGRLPPALRARVLRSLGDLLKFDAGSTSRSPVDEGRRRALAVSLVETIVAEIGQHVLDTPIAYAPEVAHTLNLVCAYLRDLAGKRPGEKIAARAARDILYLGVWGTSPHSLALGRL